MMSLGSSDDDDYELPSLADRILQASKSKKKAFDTLNDTLDKENRKPESHKSPRKIFTIPLAKNINFKSSSETEDDSFSNLCETLSRFCTPAAKQNKKNNIISDSEDESEFLKFSEMVRNTPHTPNVLKPIRISDSEDEHDVLKFSKMVYSTPHTESIVKAVNVSDSEDESEFLKFSERIRNTPRTPYILCKSESDSEDDSVFLNKKQARTCLPKSQKKHIRRTSDFYLLPNIPEKQKLFGDSYSSLNTGQSALKTPKLFKTTAEKEYDILFPPDIRTENLFLRNREKYAKQLYEFFNQYIFSSKLPADMSLKWDNSLLTTAGKTCNFQTNGVYCSYIQLSAKILTSFERLEGTLLHEMCHAAVWIISKSSNVKHGSLWKVWASRCNMIMPSIKAPTRCHNYEIQKRVAYQCTSCSYECKKMKRSRKYENAKCYKCSTPLVLRML